MFMIWPCDGKVLTTLVSTKSDISRSLYGLKLGGCGGCLWGSFFFFFLNMLYGICHYWIKKDLSRKGCGFLVI